MPLGKIFGVFNISGSGLSAQRKNLEIRAENIANAKSVDAKTGRPYRPKEVEFVALGRSGFRTLLNKPRIGLLRNSAFHIEGSLQNDQLDIESGVETKVVEKQGVNTRLVYAPNNPEANEDGYIAVPDVDSIGEMVELVSAARAYEANATVVNAAKEMYKKALDI